MKKVKRKNPKTEKKYNPKTQKDDKTASNTGQYFIQNMIKHSVLDIDDAVKYLNQISDGEIANHLQLKALLLRVNEDLTLDGFKIVIMKCEFTGKDLLVFTNTGRDAISEMQKTFSQVEVEYFYTLLKAVLSEQLFRVRSITAINLAATLSKKFSREDGQNVLDKWVRMGYFKQDVSFIYVGVKTMAEFGSFLKENCPTCLCQLCNEMVINGSICSACNAVFHCYCIKKYHATQTDCPSCDAGWVAVDNGVNE